MRCPGPRPFRCRPSRPWTRPHCKGRFGGDVECTQPEIAVLLDGFGDEVRRDRSTDPGEIFSDLPLIGVERFRAAPPTARLKVGPASLAEAPRRPRVNG